MALRSALRMKVRDFEMDVAKIGVEVVQEICWDSGEVVVREHTSFPMIFGATPVFGYLTLGTVSEVGFEAAWITKLSRTLRNKGAERG